MDYCSELSHLRIARWLLYISSVSHLHTHAIGELFSGSQPTATTCLRWSGRVTEWFCSRLGSKQRSRLSQVRPLAWGYAMPMSPDEDEAVVHDCHWRGDMVVPYRGGGTCASVLKLVSSCEKPCSRILFPENEIIVLKKSGKSLQFCIQRSVRTLKGSALKTATYFKW